MIEISLKFETAEEARAFISAASPHPDWQQPILTSPPLTVPPVPPTPLPGNISEMQLGKWYKVANGPMPATGYVGMGTRIEISASADMPDHLHVTLCDDTHQLGGFLACWHKTLPPLRKLVERTNTVLKIKRLRLMEKPWLLERKTRTKSGSSTRTSRRTSRKSSANS